jgi:hypothetical protein
MVSLPFCFIADEQSIRAPAGDANDLRELSMFVRDACLNPEQLDQRTHEQAACENRQGLIVTSNATVLRPQCRDGASGLVRT